MAVENWVTVSVNSIIIFQRTTWDQGKTTWDGGKTYWDSVAGGSRPNVWTIKAGS